MIKVLTFGVFDYFHLGHLRLFKNCKKHGDYLIVAVQNGDFILKYKPQSVIKYTTEERVEMVSAIKIVDEVKVYDIVSVEFLKTIDFDVLALGEDQTAQRFLDLRDYCLEHNKQVVWLKRTPGVCSTELKSR